MESWQAGVLFIGESLLQVCKAKVLRTRREMILKDGQSSPVVCGSLLPALEGLDVRGSTDAVSRTPR